MFLIPLFMFLFIGGLILASFVFWIVALIDVLRREFPEPNTKLLWVIIVLLGHGIGAILYFALGRQQGRIPG